MAAGQNKTLAMADAMGIFIITDNGDHTGYMNVGLTSVVPGTGATNLGKAEDAAHTSGDVGVMALGVRKATPADLSAGNTDGDYEPFQVDTNGLLWVRGRDDGPSWTSVHGVSGVPFTSADQHSAVASVTDAPTSGQKLVITDINVSVDTAMSVTFKCETTGTVITGPYYLPANGTLQLTPRSKAWKLATADKKLQVITSVAGNIMVDAHYYSEA